MVKLLIAVLMILELTAVGAYVWNNTGTPVNAAPSPTLSKTPSMIKSPIALISPPVMSPTPLAAVSPTSPGPGATPEKPTKKPSETPASGDFSKGVENYKSMDYEKAIASFKQVIKDSPGNEQAHYYLFLSYVQTEENPWSKKSGAYHEAQILAKQKNPDATIKQNIKAYLADVEKRQPQVAVVTPKPSMAAPSQPPTSFATEPPPLSTNNGVPTITSKDADIHYEKGREYDSKGNYNFAVAEYSNAIKINPKHYDAYISRGSLYETKANYQEAVRDFSKAIEIKPGDAKTYYRRGMAYKSLNEAANAKADFLKAKEIDSSMSGKIDSLIQELEKGSGNKESK